MEIRKPHINVRIGLGGDVYEINRSDIPFLKKFLDLLEWNR